MESFFFFKESRLKCGSVFFLVLCFFFFWCWISNWGGESAGWLVWYGLA